MGGKRKKSNNGPIKKESLYKIPARFDCPLCDVKSSIIVKIFRSTGMATVHCRSCQVGKDAKWPILPREQGVDVFFRFREKLLELDSQYLNEHQLGVNSREGESTGKITSLADLNRQEQRQLALGVVEGGNTAGGFANQAAKGRKRNRPASKEDQFEDSRDNNNNEDSTIDFFLPPRFDDENDGSQDDAPIAEEEQYAAMFE